ncbi:MAG: hypothetical protein PVI26_05750 [Chitinispirillia bacterium]|jgi:hypothetical protein
MREDSKSLLKVLEYVNNLLNIADIGDTEMEDDRCGVLYGIVKDSAYQIKEQVEKEIENHKHQGRWQ